MFFCFVNIYSILCEVNADVNWHTYIHIEYLEIYFSQNLSDILANSNFFLTQHLMVEKSEIKNFVFRCFLCTWNSFADASFFFLYQCALLVCLLTISGASQLRRFVLDDLSFIYLIFNFISLYAKFRFYLLVFSILPLDDAIEFPLDIDRCQF